MNSFRDPAYRLASQAAQFGPLGFGQLNGSEDLLTGGALKVVIDDEEA